MSGHIGNRHIFTPQAAQSLIECNQWLPQMLEYWEAACRWPKSGRFEVVIYHETRRFPYHDITSQVIAHLARHFNPSAYHSLDWRYSL